MPSLLLLSLLLDLPELSGELRDLILLLIDLGTELVVDLLELAADARGVWALCAVSLAALADRAGQSLWATRPDKAPPGIGFLARSSASDIAMLRRRSISSCSSFFI